MLRLVAIAAAAAFVFTPAANIGAAEAAGHSQMKKDSMMKKEEMMKKDKMMKK